MRRVAVAAGLALVALVLSGCVGITSFPYQNRPSDGGVPTDQALAALDSEPGIAEAAYWTQDWYRPGEGGLFETWGKNLYLELTVDPDHHIDDLAGFIDAAFASAWAINDGWSPYGRVFVVVEEGADLAAGWDDAAAEVFGDSAVYRQEYQANLPDSTPPLVLGARTLLGVDQKVLEQLHGSWPGAEIADLGASLAVGPFEPADPPAVTGVALRPSYAGDGCWRLTFTRAVDAETGARYDGEVTGTLSVDHRERLTVTSRSDSSAIEFCDGLADDERGITARLFAPARPGFAAVSVADLR